jgi:hypothetical protein
MKSEYTIECLSQVRLGGRIWAERRLDEGSAR